jgi:hypothetical protein
VNTPLVQGQLLAEECFIEAKRAYVAAVESLKEIAVSIAARAPPRLPVSCVCAVPPSSLTFRVGDVAQSARVGATQASALRLNSLAPLRLLLPRVFC